MSTIVGALACQKNSYLKTLNATVVKSYEYVLDKKKRSPAVQLSDTVLFPEGGGQPYDQGRLLYDKEAVKVTQVIRDNLHAVHVTERSIPEGTAVTVELDWPRRLDHMQQHSGQHLLSAVFDQYDLPTLSWQMGADTCYVELPRKVDEETLAQVAAKVNAYIQEDLPITTSTPDIKSGDFDCSKLPDDYDFSQGVFRVVCIGDIDYNPCCGTHLSRTSEIQAVAILHQTPVTGGHSRVHFTCGSRVPRLLSQFHANLKNVAGSQLSCQIDEVAQKVELLNLQYRQTRSREQTLLREIASNEAKKVYESGTPRKVHCVHRQEPDFPSLFTKELATLVNGEHRDVGTVVLITGDYPGQGTVRVSGERMDEVRDGLKERIGKLKGGGKGVFQGKVEWGKGEVQSVVEYLSALD